MVKTMLEAGIVTKCMVKVALNGLTVSTNVLYLGSNYNGEYYHDLKHG